MAKADFITGEALGKKLLAAARDIGADRGRVVYSPVIAARTASKLSQSEFAALLGVSLRTLQEWEQGRREPSGAAKTLLRIAQRHPAILRDLVS